MKPGRKFCTSLTGIFLLPLVFYSFLLPGRQDGETFRFMFYNVENLFDTIDDPQYLDEEYTPQGERRWDSWKYYRKIHRIFQVVAATGDREPPELIGLCEVENKQVLSDLIRNTPLAKYSYGIIHEESADHRGMDVALLYRKDCFFPLMHESWAVKNPDGKILPTRSVLYVCGKASCGECIHLLITHWPSRYNPQEMRIHTSDFISAKIDSLKEEFGEIPLLLAGDLNDNPSDPAPAELIRRHSLTDLMAASEERGDVGSIKYQGRWYCFDQILLSPQMEKGSVRLLPGSFRIVNPEFLLEKDENYLGTKPRRSYTGYRYTDGFSDHLPVVAEFVCSP